jgi:hypothetical protein
MKSFKNANTLEVTFDRDRYTKHGLYLNGQGKEGAAKTNGNSIKENLKLQKKYPIKMGWKEAQELEGANTVSSNVDKDGDQILYEQ